jgi:hypothetical protein
MWKSAMEEEWLLSFMAPKGVMEWVRRLNDEGSRAPAKDPRRPDVLATRYGKLFRWSYVLKYVLASFAVCFAVAGLMPGQAEIEVWPALELASIVGVLLTFLLSRAGEWHERWLDYRLLAEQFRVLDFLHPLGETVPVFHPPTYWGVPPWPSCVCPLVLSGVPARTRPSQRGRER